MYRRISVAPNTPNICWIIVQVQKGKNSSNSFSKGHCHPHNLAPFVYQAWLKWLYSISPAALFAWLNPSICNHRAWRMFQWLHTHSTSTVFFSTAWSTWLCIKKVLCPCHSTIHIFQGRSHIGFFWPSRIPVCCFITSSNSLKWFHPKNVLNVSSLVVF